MSLTAQHASLFLRIQAFLIGAALGMALVAPAQADVDIEQKPLFTTPSVTPALILTVDDSGSMDSEILMKTNDGALWWHTGNDSFTGLDQTDQAAPGVINFNRAGSANGTWKKYVYLFPNGLGRDAGRRNYQDNTHDHYAVPPIGDFAFTRSHQYNMMYFNPATTYEPWPSLGGDTFVDSVPTSAKTDPTKGSATIDLTAPQESKEDNYVFKMYEGMRIPAGTKYYDWIAQVWVTAAADIPAEDLPKFSDKAGRIPISYFPATFFLGEGTPLPAGYGYIATPANDGKAPDGSTMDRYEIKPGNFASSADYDAAIQNFANWFTYYHKRHIATRGAMGMAFEDIYGFRIGSYLINTNPPSSLPFRDMSVAGDRLAFFNMIYRDFIGGGGTPNRLAVNRMWDQLTRTDSGAPIQEKCQMNFGVLFTDGYSNANNTGVGERDDELGAPFADPDHHNTMADIAARLYLDNPRPDLDDGQVPVPLGCGLASPSPALDCNTDLHLNLFAITMGAPGSIFNVDADQTADPYTNPPTWPDVSAVRNPVQIDDLWHATLNSRGKLLSVDVPSELGQKFGEILADIGSRLETSSSSAATSSAVLNTSTLIYTAGFRSEDWSGTFTAHSVEDEKQGDLVWDAEEELVDLGAANRKIFTRAADTAGTGAGATFTWGNLTATQQGALNYNKDDIADGLGEDRVAWIRGDEGANAAFRDREGALLGDIVNSDPQYDAGVLYVGANDGMLHAFNGTNGEEIFAFIPSELLLPEPARDLEPAHQFARLSRLTDAAYSHRYMMDGSVAIATTGAGQKVLVGGLGAGGRSVFALDVTDPHGFDAAHVLWEFRDADLGYGIGQPLVGQFNDGTWVAVFGNGYNSDYHHACLFIVDLLTGTLIRKIDTGIGDATTPNGLAAPIGTHWPELNGKAQRIYAGDLLGNLWRFDVSDPAEGSWTFHLLFTALDDDGNPQPITSRPAVGLSDADADYAVVSFGTGSYFRTSDKTDDQIQSLYGIFDNEDGSVRSTLPVRSSTLQEQSIVLQDVAGFGSTVHRFRVVSDNAVDDATQHGWYLDLDEEDTDWVGERVISDAKIASGGGMVRVRYSTLIPDDDVCGSGRDGYVMDIDLATGGRTASAVFDLDYSGAFDAGDQVLLDGVMVEVSGINYGQGEQIITVGSLDKPYELLIPGGDFGGQYARGLKSGPDAGRQGWQQLK